MSKYEYVLSSANRSVLVVVSFKYVLNLTNPLLRSCISKRSRNTIIRICLELGESSAEIVCIKAFSLWQRANVS